MLRLILTAPDGQSESIELRPGNNRVGRGPDNDITIEHATISSTHCEIQCQDSGVTVTDCGSTNGTFINGQPVKQSALKPGDRLQLGDVPMVLESAPIIVAIPPVDFREPPPPPPLADGSLACLHHPEARARRKCTQCQKSFCEPCIHTLRRIGGKIMKLCPLCSGPCELIPWPE